MLTFRSVDISDFAGYVQQSQQSSRTVADAIAAALRRAVLDGALRDGAVLRQADLAAKFGVSRIPVREALLKLQADGLVEAQPRRGTVVVALNADDFEEILEMRAALEPLALKFAIPKMTPEDIRVAAGILEGAQQSVERSASTPDGRREFETRWGDMNWAFHRAVYLPARKRRLLDQIQHLHVLFARHLRLRVEVIAPAFLPTANVDAAARDTTEWANALDEHRAILNACERGDTRLACSILTKHIAGHGQELVRRLRDASKVNAGSKAI